MQCLALDARSLAERMARYEAARIAPAPPRARLANGEDVRPEEDRP